MFDLSWSETAIVALVALVAIGPKELPAVLRSVGGWVRKFRELGYGLMDEITKLDGDASPAKAVDEEERYILDDEGKPHRVYDLSDLRAMAPADKTMTNMPPTKDNPASNR